WVLQATAMPSVLVETGFLTNREEEDYLNSKEGQAESARCVTQAVRNYIDWLQKSNLQNSNTESNRPASSNDTKAFLNMIETNEKNGS
ncbi:MAG TPA: N-acetylmuramoyl-L-alanine amidase, partial [Chitinophagaceae bacterium]|nr:N-acetylmuramoyl-L-alanine amidase [Chitinophagaceae bacterium]